MQFLLKRTVIYIVIYYTVHWSLLYFTVLYFSSTLVDCTLLYVLYCSEPQCSIKSFLLYFTLLCRELNILAIQLFRRAGQQYLHCTTHYAVNCTIHYAVLHITKETAVHTARYTPLFTLHTYNFILCPADSSIAELSGNLSQATSIHWLLILGIFLVCSAFCTFREV